jgi:hypothetical protein
VELILNKVEQIRQQILDLVIQYHDEKYINNSDTQDKKVPFSGRVFDEMTVINTDIEIKSTLINKIKSIMNSF